MCVCMCVCVCVCVKMCQYQPVWSNTDLQTTNTTVDIAYTPWDQVTSHIKYINHLDRSSPRSAVV